MVPVVIVGAGLAGLAAGRELQRQDIAFEILEASDRPGGKLRTDRVDGYQLDQGFQVFFAAYPAAARELDYASLDLRKFRSGARVFHQNRWYLIDEGKPIETALSSLFGLGDKLRTLAWRAAVHGADVRSGIDQTAEAYLRQRGFSDRYLDRFARPFFGGITLDRSLGISSQQLNFIFQMLSAGGATVPAGGIEAIPRQMASGLPIRYQSPVAGVTSDGVRMASGELIPASAVILAVPGPVVKDLLGEAPAREYRASTCLWFSCPVAPFEGAYLALDGDATGPVNHLAVMTNAAPSYGPGPLVAATVIGADADETAVRSQLKTWFPAGRIDEWNVLRKDVILNAQPTQPPGRTPTTLNPRPNVFLAGEEFADASINGAIESGVNAARRAAAAVKR